MKFLAYFGVGAYGVATHGMARTRDNSDAMPSRGRISLPLTPDGSGFDFEQMRPSSKQKLYDLVSQDLRSIYVEAGQPDPAAEADPGGAAPDLFGGLTLENVRAGLDILSQVNVLAFRVVAPRLVKHPFKKHPVTGRPLPLVIDPDILATSFTLTEKQHAELDPRALKVANKYSHKMPPWMKEHLDLVMLGSMYLKYTGENALRTMQVQVTRDLAAAKVVHEKAAKPRPIDTDARPHDPDAVRLGDDEPMSNTPDTYPPPVTGNGGMEVGL